MKPRKQLLCRLQNLPWLLPTHKSQPGSENVPQCQGGHHGCADSASWGRGFPQGCCGAPAAVQRAQRACRCHSTGRERRSGMPQKAAAQDSPPFLICAIRSWGNDWSGPRDSVRGLSAPPQLYPSHIPARCWKSCMWVPVQAYLLPVEMG